MKKQLISWGEYNYYLEKTRWADDNETTVDDLIDIYEYLKDKSVKEYSFDDEPNIIKYAHIKFLGIALGRSHVFAYYNPGTEGFLKSDYISKEETSIDDKIRLVLHSRLIVWWVSDARFCWIMYWNTYI